LARSAYITAMEPQSGKSIVALGLMEMLSARVERVGFLRPIVPAGGVDPQVELMRRRYKLGVPYDEMCVLTDAEALEAIADGRYDELKKQVVAAFRKLADACDVVVCEGTDFTPGTPGLDLDVNADLANELGSPVLVVVRGESAEGATAAARLARESLEKKGCELFGVFVNRVPVKSMAAVVEDLAAEDAARPAYVLPEQPELSYPTVAEVAEALNARPVAEPGEGRRASWLGGSPQSGEEDLLRRDVRDVRIGAMSVEHFIDDLVPGTLVVVPGDRSDILIASIISTLSSAFPAVAGVVITGGYELHPALRRLLVSAPFAVLEVATRTYAAAAAIQAVRPTIRPDDERKIAAALGAFESGVDADQLEAQINLERPARLTPIMFEYELIERARASPQHIVLPEGDDERILRAAEILLRRSVVELTILGDVDDVQGRAAALGLDLSAARFVDPATAPERSDYAATYHGLRKHKGVTEELAYDTVADASYFGTLMVHAGDADGMVSGAAHTTGDTIRPAFEVIKPRKGVSLVSSVFLMCLSDRVLVYGDCAVNPNPDVEQLADIAISSAETAATFGVDPRIAMLSYSTGASGTGAGVDAVRAATELVRERRPDLKVEGPIQYDAAVDAGVAAKKLPGSEVAGQATVFVFPDLDTGNIAYKAVQRSAGALAVGPVLQGLNKPVNDLSRGCLVADIVNTVAITAIQAQDEGERRASRFLDIPVLASGGRS
jgi:phosphate acetyltransferase